MCCRKNEDKLQPHPIMLGVKALECWLQFASVRKYCCKALKTLLLSIHLWMPNCLRSFHVHHAASHGVKMPHDNTQQELTQAAVCWCKVLWTNRSVSLGMNFQRMAVQFRLWVWIKLSGRHRVKKTEINKKTATKLKIERHIEESLDLTKWIWWQTHHTHIQILTYCKDFHTFVHPIKPLYFCPILMLNLFIAMFIHSNWLQLCNLRLISKHFLPA